MKLLTLKDLQERWQRSRRGVYSIITWPEISRVAESPKTHLLGTIKRRGARLSGVIGVNAALAGEIILVVRVSRNGAGCVLGFLDLQGEGRRKRHRFRVYVIISRASYADNDKPL